MLTLWVCRKKKQTKKKQLESIKISIIEKTKVYLSDYYIKNKWFFINILNVYQKKTEEIMDTLNN